MRGSPLETDDERSAYVIRLPVYPLVQAPDEAAMQVTGEVTGEIGRLLRACVDRGLNG